MNSHTIRFWNVSSNTTEQHIKKCCTKYGVVCDVWLDRTADTGYVLGSGDIVVESRSCACEIVADAPHKIKGAWVQFKLVVASLKVEKTPKRERKKKKIPHNLAFKAKQETFPKKVIISNKQHKQHTITAIGLPMTPSSSDGFVWGKINNKHK